MELNLNIFDEKELKILLEIFGLQKLQEEFTSQVANKNSPEVTLSFNYDNEKGCHIEFNYSKKDFLISSKEIEENKKQEVNRSMSYTKASSILGASPTIMYPWKLKNFFTDPPKFDRKLYLVTVSGNQFKEHETPVEYDKDTKELKYVRAPNTKRIKSNKPFDPQSLDLIYYRPWEKEDDHKPKSKDREVLIDYVQFRNSKDQHKS